jgi:AraC-like DNA-binding protein
MKSELYTPKNPKVSHIVNCIGYVEMSVTDSHEGWFGLFPNGSSNLTFSLRDDTIQYDKEKGHAILYASYNSPAALKKTSSLKFINVQFKPFGLYSLKAIPMYELKNTSLTLDTFFSDRESEELLDRLYHANELADKFWEVETFLSERINANLFDDRLNFALSLIHKSPSQTMDSLSKSVCLSPRRFRELFSDQTGFSPSFYKKIIRFTKATRQMSKHPDIPLTQVALTNGYYDQAHFIKDFRFFAGITPSQFLKLKAKTTDFYNYNLSDISKFANRPE